MTIEKLLKTFKLIDLPDNKFKKVTRDTINTFYKNTWTEKVALDAAHLNVYSIINSQFPSTHLDLPFPLRRVISKIRCSNHTLEIEKGRHFDIIREERLCKLCHANAIEDENHFLLKCQVYQPLREYYTIQSNCLIQLLKMDDQKHLGKYLLSAFELRTRLIQGREGD